jgi:UDP-N-acetylglucosamine 2-epimerase (non-hydrolysing)
VFCINTERLEQGYRHRPGVHYFGSGWLSVLIDGIVGARPNMIKMAPLARGLGADGTFRLRLVHTGQHYEETLSEVFFRELGLPTPDINLGVGSGSQGEQTARILAAYERLLLESDPKPRGVLVVGDVNSTLACTLAAVKLGIPVAHIEAGLRSGDRSMPEEINRVVTDALSELLFVSDPAGLGHLAREGRPRENTWLVGNIMMDSLYRELPKVQQSRILHDLDLKPGSYAYLTLHRPSNVDDELVLRQILNVISELCKDIRFVFALHPRTSQRMEQAGIALPASDRIHTMPPLGYRDNLHLIECARVVLTDSGGIQEETAVLNVPCLTLRETTERPITVKLGTSELVGNDPKRIKDAWSRLLAKEWKQAHPIPLWDGHTAERICQHLRDTWG